MRFRLKMRSFLRDSHIFAIEITQCKKMKREKKKNTAIHISYVGFLLVESFDNGANRPGEKTRRIVVPKPES